VRNVSAGREKEPVEKFIGGERERADLTTVSVVLPAEGDGVVSHVEEPVIRDGDAVRVAREVVQYVDGTAKRRLGVHDPRLAIEESQVGT
jgi:hypothetical protein